MDCESTLDKEFSNSMALYLKVMVMAMLGYSHFSLSEFSPCVVIDDKMAEKRFLVSRGQLSVGMGCGWG